MSANFFAPWGVNPDQEIAYLVIGVIVVAMMALLLAAAWGLWGPR